MSTLVGVVGLRRKTKRNEEREVGKMMNNANFEFQVIFVGDFQGNFEQCFF